MERPATLGGPGAAVLARTLSMRSAPNPAMHIVRRFSASPERVFDAWFDPEKLRVWMFKPPWGGMLRMRIDF